MHVTSPPPRSVPAAQASSSPETHAFDRWLQDNLGRLYGDVLNEPLPESLRALLEQPRK